VAVSSNANPSATTRSSAIDPDLTCLRSSWQTRPGHRCYVSGSRAFISPTHIRLAGDAPSRLLERQGAMLNVSFYCK
jgi:hypothetical protein